MKTEFANGFVGIRPFVPEDARALQEAVLESVHELIRWMTWCSPQYSLQDGRDFIARAALQWQAGERFSFVIYDRKDRALLGSLGLSHLEPQHRFANLGYWVRTSRTGEGIASKALCLAVRFALTELSLERVELVIPVNNWASRRVAEVAGAVKEGVLRKRLVLQQKPCDALLYSFVPGDMKCLSRAAAGLLCAC